MVLHFMAKLTGPVANKERILNWLSSGDFNARHETVAETHAEGTGMWLIEDLDDWSNGRGERIILCTGPGIKLGKTSLIIFRRGRKDLSGVRLGMEEIRADRELDTS